MARWKVTAVATALVATHMLASADVQIDGSTSTSTSTNNDAPPIQEETTEPATATASSPPSSNNDVHDEQQAPMESNGFVSWEMLGNDLAADSIWTQALEYGEPEAETTAEAGEDVVELARGERASGDSEQLQQAEEQLRSALEALLAQVQEQASDPSAPQLSIDVKTVEQLEQLAQEAVTATTAEHSALESLFGDEIFADKYDDSSDLADLSELADQILDELEEAAANGGGGGGDASATEPELTEEFLDLEKRISREGFTDELVSQMQSLATEQQDVYAKETLAYMALFEPSSTVGNFTQAFVDLRSAADAGVVSAISTLALLNLVDFGVPRKASTTAHERHQAAQSVLIVQAASRDLAASLAVGYRYLSGTMIAPPRDKEYDCASAVMYYHRCAESNIKTLADQGGEKPHQIVERLSEEWIPSSSFVDENNHVDPAQRLEYYRTIATDPADPQWIEATEHIGLAYMHGDDAAGVEQNQPLAAQYFQRVADAGDAHAQANYGLILANGLGVPQNNASAFSYFRSAADQDNAYAHYGLGAMYFVGSAPVEKNETLAVLYFEKAAELGYNEAHTYLGSAYLHGRGVEVNGSKAFEHFLIAAETKSSQALFNLAVVQYRGVGTPKSCELAVHNFRMVALHPDVLADLPFSLGKGYECYQKRDYLRAYLNYRLVAEFGDEDAQINAAYLLENFGDAIFPQQQQQSGEDGVREASIPWMGLTKTPLAEAYRMYSHAANLNDTEGIRKTAMCFYDEWGGVCERNRSIALERYSLAAELGDSEAAFNCGLMYALGDGIGRSLETAKTYYAQCSDAEFPANVPCAIALAVLETILTLQSVAQQLLGIGQS